MCSTRTTELWDLPNELVQHIADFLHEDTLATFARLHPRLTAICQNSASFQRIRIRNIDEWLLRFINPKASRIRVLNLCQCWSDPECMTALIQRCQNLEQLIVVDTPLHLDRLLPVLDHLRALQELSVTVSHFYDEFRTGSSVEIEEVNIPRPFLSLRKICLEFRPRDDERRSAVKFLKACPNVRHLHAILVGSQSPARPGDFTGESLTKYDSVVISSDTRRRDTASSAFRLIFEMPNRRDLYGGICCSVFRYQRGILEQDLVRDDLHRELELSVPGNVAAIPESCRNEQIIGLRIFGSRGSADPVVPRLDALSSIVELNFTELCWNYSAEIWQSLVDSSPMVEALAIPACALLQPDDPTGMSEVRIMEALSKLNLKRLYVTSHDYCEGYEISAVFMELLGDFHRLEELILHDIKTSRDFFDRVRGRPPIRTLKMNLITYYFDTYALVKFLELCDNLRNLKLDFRDMPVGDARLWRALTAANLKQLCLSSAVWGCIDLEKLKHYLVQPLASLDVLHLHIRPWKSVCEVRAVLEEARIANVARKSNPVQVMVVDRCTMVDFDDCPHPKFAGRSVCSMRTFIGESRPTGWDCD